MPDHDPHHPDWLALAKRICRAPEPELFVPGDRVFEPRWPDTILTVVSCKDGYVKAERPGIRSSGPAGDFRLFALAGEFREEPKPKVVPMSAVARLEASHDGRIPHREYEAARAVDAEAAAALMAQDGERPAPRMAAE